MSALIIRINTKDELKRLAQDLGVRNDWHEPDEQGLTVFGFGSHFDNAGHWGLEFLSRRELDARIRLYDAGGNTGKWTLSTTLTDLWKCLR